MSGISWHKNVKKELAHGSCLDLLSCWTCLACSGRSDLESCVAADGSVSGR
jgi:hypothetical protein